MKKILIAIAATLCFGAVQVLGLSGASAQLGAPGLSANVSPALSGPGYVAGPYYLPFGVQSRTSTGVAPAATTSMYCSPFWLGNVSAGGGGSGTLGVTFASISTAGTTTAQMGIYANDNTPSGGGPYRPGTLLTPVSTQPSMTSGQPNFTFTSGPSLSANAMYWGCVQFGDTTVRYNTLPTTANGSQNVYTNLVGTVASSGAGQGGTPPISGIVTTVSAYGTFPSTLHGATMTESQQGPWFGFNFSSIQ